MGKTFNLARIAYRWSFLFPQCKDSQASLKTDQRQFDRHLRLVFPPGPYQDLQNFSEYRVGTESRQGTHLPHDSDNGRGIYSNLGVDPEEICAGHQAFLEKLGTSVS